MLPVPAENVSIKSSRLSLESARRKGGTELKQLLTKETHAHTDTRSKMRDMRMFTLYYIPADSYKTAYIIERTRTHLPGSKLHAAASRIFFRETNRKEKSMNWHAEVGLPRGGGIHALQREASCSGVTCPGGQSTPGGYSFRDSLPLRVTILIAYTSLSMLAGVNYYINTL